jgi:general secretion pathway protein A
MYLDHYGFNQLPFRNTPDPRFFYETPRHNEALANLIYAVEQRRGFVLLSGEIGSGKTLVTHLLLKHIEDHAQIALVRNTHLNSAQLIRLICDEFGVQVPEDADKAAMLLALNSFLIQQLAEDRLVVVIIDEAQNLSDKVLEELRMLSNLETSSEKLLQIVIVGQPELREKVSQPHLEQLRQRIALSYHLEPLTLEEITAYMDHRMKIAGPDHKAVFTPEAVAKIARFSRGTPRIINGLCDNALLYGFTAGTTTIDEKLIDKVLKNSMHLAPRQHLSTQMPVGGVSTPGSTARGVRGAGRVIAPPGFTDVDADKKKVPVVPPPAPIPFPNMTNPPRSTPNTAT